MTHTESRHKEFIAILRPIWMCALL